MQNIKSRKKAWVSSMDIGGFNQSEVQISLRCRSVLHNKSNKMFILVRKKPLWTRVIKFRVPPFIRHEKEVFGFFAALGNSKHIFCIEDSFFLTTIEYLL